MDVVTVSRAERRRLRRRVEAFRMANPDLPEVVRFNQAFEDARRATTEFANAVRERKMREHLASRRGR